MNRFAERAEIGAGERQANIAAVLDAVNKERERRGLPKLADLIPGTGGSGWECVIQRSLGVPPPTFDTCNEGCPQDAYVFARNHDATVGLFMSEWDKGWWPEYYDAQTFAT